MGATIFEGWIYEIFTVCIALGKYIFFRDAECQGEIFCCRA
jgi:hypothetical protein